MDDQLEDGEILDDDEHTTIVQPTTSDSKESEIDRIIEETKAIDGKSSPKNRIVQLRNDALLFDEPVMEDPEIRALRLAALGTLGKTVKDKNDKPITAVISMSNHSRKRRRSSESKSSKYKSSSSKSLSSSSRDRDRSSHRSSREKEREREKESYKSSRSVLSEKNSKESTSKASDKEETRTSRGRVTADVVLGEESKEITSLRKSTSPIHVEDNYDNVGMDIDSNCSEPETHRRNDEEPRGTLQYDAGKHNGIIYEGTTTRVDALPNEVFSKDEYRVKYDSLQKLDKLIRSRIDDIEEAHERKNKIMIELENLMKSLEDYKNDYVKAIKDRDELRKELSDYEQQKINRLLFGNIEFKPKEEPRVSVVTTPEQPEPESVPVSVSEPVPVPVPVPVIPAVVVETVTQSSEIVVKETNSSVHDEERLRKNLLEKLRSAQQAKGSRRPSAEKHVLPTNNRSPGSVESADEENSNNSSFASLRDSLEPLSTPREVNYGTNSSMYPPRFMCHLGLSERNPLTHSCPYEIMGRCKDYACSYDHLRDDELDVRDLILMFIQYRNIGQQDSRKKIDEILQKKKSDESGFQFFVRLLQGKTNIY